MPPTIYAHPELARVSAHVEGRTVLLPALRPTPREIPQSFEIAMDEGLLLGAAPALHLPLGGDGVGDVRKFLMKDKNDGSAPCRIAAEATRIVLRDAGLKVRSRRADIVRVVRAAQNVEVGGEVSLH